MKKTTTTRRGARKPSAEPCAVTDDEASVPEPALKKRGRKAATPKPDEGETDNSVATTSKPTRRGRGQAGAASETEEEDDAGQGHEKADVAEVKPKRGRPRKGTITTPAVPEAIKEEEAETPPVATTTGRKKASAAASSRSKTSTVLTSNVRATRKTAGPAKEAEGETDPGVDKENNDSQDEVVITKTTRGRPKKGVSAAAKEVKEEAASEPELGTTAKRSTRSTRARTRT
jgi:hypothetical protein